MKCIYCGAVIKDNETTCPVCNRDVQLVPDYNIMDDEYLKQLMEEKDGKSTKGSKSGHKSSGKSAEYEGDDELHMQRENEKSHDSSGGKKKSDENKSQKGSLIAVSVLVVIFVAAVIVAAVFYKINSDHANSFDYQVSKAEEAVEEGDTDSAISYYERALKLNQNSNEVRMALGELYMSIKDYESALVMYQEAVNLDDSDVDAYRGLLSVYEAQGDYDSISNIRDEIDDVTILTVLSDYLVDAPTFSMESGEYDYSIEVSLSADTGCTIWYTTDGSDPLVYGSRYSSSFTFDSDGTYNIYAIAVNENSVCSETVTAKYVIDIAPPSAPVVSPEGGNYTKETQITITVPDGCTAYYTWDGTNPDDSSTEYDEPFTIPIGSNVLSVVIIDDKTGKSSSIYRSNYTYYES